MMNKQTDSKPQRGSVDHTVVAVRILSSHISSLSQLCQAHCQKFSALKGEFILLINRR